MERNRLIITFVLIGIMLISIIVLFVKRDTIFSQEVQVRYPDNCVEKFRNGVAITPLCTTGRIMQEQQDAKLPESTGVVVPQANYTQSWSK